LESRTNAWILARSSCADVCCPRFASMCLFELLQQGAACHCHLSGSRTQLQQPILGLHMWPAHCLRNWLHSPLCRLCHSQLAGCSSRVERWTHWWRAGQRRVLQHSRCSGGYCQQHRCQQQWPLEYMHVECLSSQKLSVHLFLPTVLLQSCCLSVCMCAVYNHSF